jgi:isopenicillin-N N-acyltransferase like protein
LNRIKKKVWGNATKNGETIQLRSLDWDFDGPFKNHPAVIVYHPSNEKIGNTFANIGFTGWLGMLSGVNEHKMGMSEIGVYFSDASFGKESRIGNVFTFMMRDVI